MKVVDHPDLIRRNGRIVNIDSEKYLAAKARYKRNAEIDELSSKINKLEKTIGDLVDLLNQKGVFNAN